MNIGQLISREFTVSQTETGGQATRDRAAWLRQLERAQWESRSRYQESDQKKMVVQDDVAAGATPHAGTSEARPLNATDPEESSYASSLIEAGDAGATPQLQPAADVQTAADYSPTPVLRADAPRVQIAEMPAGAARDTAPAVSAAEVPQWAAQSVHVQVAQRTAIIWIRDAQIAPSQGIAILRELRSALRAWGYDLDRISLNGQPVDRT